MGALKKCEQITLLFEASNFQKLSVEDREELKMHLDKCKKCDGYIKDSKKLDLWLKRRFEQLDQTVHFTSEEKEAIKEKCGKH